MSSGFHMRIGQGIDAHRFQAGRRLVLCGVEIEHEYGLEAHSDGDVALHAVCDALLGAAGLGDIGRHFPDTDEAHRDADSRMFVQRVMNELEHRKLRVVNVDVTIVAQRPRLAPHIPEMTRVLSDLVRAPANVKATTTERMGFTGREEGIAAFAVCLIERIVEAS